MLTDSGRLVINELKYVSRAIAVDNLTSIVSNLAEIRQNLANIEKDTGLLQDKANQLQVSTRSVFFLAKIDSSTVVISLTKLPLRVYLYLGRFVGGEEAIEAVAGSMR